MQHRHMWNIAQLVVWLHALSDQTSSCVFWCITQIHVMEYHITHPSGNCSYCWIVLLYQVTVFVNTVKTILQTLYYTIYIWTRVTLVRKLCRRSKHENTRYETNRHPSTVDHQYTKFEICRTDVNYNGWQGPCHDKISLPEGSYVADVNRNHISCIRQKVID